MLAKPKADGAVYVGFGITRNMKIRMAAHTLTLRRYGAKLTLVTKKYFKVGADALKLEKAIKDEVHIINLGVPGFRKEAAAIGDISKIIGLMSI